MRAFEIANALEQFAARQGFVAPPAYYIVGEISIRTESGAVYSDEAHLWCKPCADALLARALPLLPEGEREEHFVCETDASNEDSCPHCMSCGETLSGGISEFGVAEELEHYSYNPIRTGDVINPRQATEIAMLLNAAPEDPEAFVIATAALKAITDAGDQPAEASATARPEGPAASAAEQPRRSS